MLKDFEHQYIFKEDTEQSKDAQFQACRDAGKEAAYASIGTGDLNSEYTPSPIKDPDIQMEYCNTDDRDYLKDIYLVWGYGIGIIITDVTLYTDTGEIVEGEPEVGRETISGKWLKFTGQNNRSPIRIGSVNLPENIICLKDLTKALSFGSEKCIIEDFDTSHVINMDNAFENCYINGTINLDFTSCKTAKYCFANVCYDDNPTINVSNFNPNIIGDGMYANNNKFNIKIPEFIWRNNYNAPYMFYNTRLVGKLVDLYPGYSPKLYSYSFYVSQIINYNEIFYTDFTDFTFSDTDINLTDCINVTGKGGEVEINSPIIHFNDNLEYAENVINCDIYQHSTNTVFNINLDYSNVLNNISNNKGLIYITRAASTIINIICGSTILNKVIYQVPYKSYYMVKTTLTINITNICVCNKFNDSYISSSTNGYNYFAHYIVNGRIHFKSRGNLYINSDLNSNGLKISYDSNIYAYGIVYDDIRGFDYQTLVELINNNIIDLNDCYVNGNTFGYLDWNYHINDIELTYDKTDAIYNKNCLLSCNGSNNIINIINPDSVVLLPLRSYNVTTMGELNIISSKLFNITYDYYRLDADNDFIFWINARNAKIVNNGYKEFNVVYIKNCYSYEGGNQNYGHTINILHVDSDETFNVKINSLSKKLNYLNTVKNSNIRITGGVCIINDYETGKLADLNLEEKYIDYNSARSIIAINVNATYFKKVVTKSDIQQYPNQYYYDTNLFYDVDELDITSCVINMIGYVKLHLNFDTEYIIDYSKINYIITGSGYKDYIYIGNNNAITAKDDKPIKYYAPKSIKATSYSLIVQICKDVYSSTINFTIDSYCKKLIVPSESFVEIVTNCKFKSAAIANSNFQECLFNNIDDNIDMKACPNLTQACLDSLVNISSTITSGKTITLHTTAFQKLTEEQKTIISSKMTLVEYIPEA